MEKTKPKPSASHKNYKSSLILVSIVAIIAIIALLVVGTAKVKQAAMAGQAYEGEASQGVRIYPGTNTAPSPVSSNPVGDDHADYYRA